MNYTALPVILALIFPAEHLAHGQDKPSGQRAKSTDNKKPKRSDNRNSAKPRRLLEVTAEREAAARTFVKQNHAELSELLIYLKENRQREYHRAIRDLFRNSERLAVIREQDETRYKLELDLWKNQSRLQLITAKLRMRESPDLRTQLKNALEEQVDKRIALLKYDKQRFAERIRKLDTRIERLQNNRHQTVESQMQSLAKKRTAKAASKRTIPTKTSAPQKQP